jgi:hypothetical protein
MFKRTGLAIAVFTCAAVLGSSLTGATLPDMSDADTAVSAVQAVAPRAVSGVAQPNASSGSAVAVESAGATVTVPVDASTGIQVKPDGPVVGTTIGLPYANSADSATRSKTAGVVVYDNNNGSSTIPVAHTDGSVQITTVLNDASAPTRYDYPLTLPAGRSVKLTADGGAMITDRSGQQVGRIATPWAKDANGAPVATRYEVHGNTLTQIIQTTVHTAFPVVADPTYWWGGKVWLKQSEVSVTKVSALAASFLGAGFVGLLTAGALEI